MSTGRPRATSRDTIAEAACELFLEQGYEGTTVADITRRAGVSRSSFFNYFGSKADVIWGGLDERIAALTSRLGGQNGAGGESGGGGAPDVDAALRALADGFAPDSLALALVNSDAMGLTDEIEREAGLRRSRIAVLVAARLRENGVAPLRADVAAAAYAGAVLAAIGSWAVAGAGQTPLAPALHEAMDAAAAVLDEPADAPAVGDVRQLRVVASAADFESALVFYRDVLGMPEQESYQGDGGARVAILGAGRATLELSNAAQVDLIDHVETDGDAPSEAIRIALEVDDAAAATERAADAGAALEAAARETPWRSLNARVRAPAGLQVTLFQELDVRP